MASSDKLRMLAMGISDEEFILAPSMRRLRKLERAGHIVIHQVTTDSRTQRAVNEEVKRRLPKYGILLLMPTRRGYLDRDVFQGVSEPLNLATISKRIDHLPSPLGPNIRVFSVKGAGNAPAVAELTLNMAINCLRPVFDAAYRMSRGDSNIAGLRTSSSLMRKTWTIVGAGYQARCLIPLIVSFGVKRIRILDYRAGSDEGVERFRKCLQGVPGQLIQYSHHRLAAKVLWSADVEISGAVLPSGLDGSWHDCLADSDIVSLHLPYNPPLGLPGHAPGRPVTRHLVDAKFIAAMKDGAILLNPSHGDLIVGGAVLAELPRIRYATDLVSAIAERSGLPADCPIWNYVSQRGEAPFGTPVLLFPHVGATTIEAFDACATDVLDQLFVSLSITESPDRNIRRSEGRI